MEWRRAATAPVRTLNRLVEATPDSRDRVVDAARALCIVVVILWHWVLSITHRSADGSLVMPNPIHEVPGAWLATWVLQVMPLFFVVGGYANLAALERARDAGTSAWQFVGDRLRRLLYPAAAWAAVWLAFEGVAAALPGEHRWIWEWFPGYLVPLWFLGVYAAMIALVPLTSALHARAGAATLAALVVLMAAGTVLERRVDTTWAAWTTAAVVWIFCHQLGYAWRGWKLGRRPLVVRIAIAVAGLAALTAITSLADYPRSMVATVGAPESNIFPTTAAIAALALFQLGLLAVLTPPAQRVLQRPAWWRPVVAVNAVAMTVFVWHMSAYLVVVWIYEATGATLPAEPDTQWWSQRWLWLLAPAAVLAVLTAVFARVEIASRGRRS
ncbi:acyltransferase [Mycobacterium sp. SMC-4]|uniref:acyltransferase family protein n=1 Tax=Mycobacterium sp. SMC-4 TaxID=2857059 RepID=UPI0021B341C3|nr:acyltransferase [Mycobacterium sp. SMC-4]UXA18748.1 acyltransferase [Mycobacterium sp. SMC-4]